MSTAELRESFLLHDLFASGEFRFVLTDADRLALAGVIPKTTLALPPLDQFGTSFFTERRELGVFNIGAPGIVKAGDECFHVGRLDCLYIGLGNPEVAFASEGDEPAMFYLASCPAHRSFPATLIRAAEAEAEQLGSAANANCRRIRRYIHPDGAGSCQLVMGMTELAAGAVWNTMPPHTHSRRSEVYLYFDLPKDQSVIHLFGEPAETRHLVVRNREAVISPPWSIHSGVGTSSYRFVWVMAGENQEFGDMDRLSLRDLA